MRRPARELYRVPQRIDEHGNVWSQRLSHMDFASARVGWAVGSGQLLHTRDGGETWVNEYDDLMQSTSFGPYKVRAVTEHEGWVITIGPNPACCFYTEDGGESWQIASFDSVISPKDLFFSDPERGWLLSDNGEIGGPAKLHITDNGGRTWHTTEIALKGRAECIRFLQSGVGWLAERAITHNNTSSGRLYRSDDGAYTWTLAATFKQPILDIVALDEQHILVSGESGFISGTSDGGKTWQQARTRTRQAINCLTSRAEKKAIAAGDFGVLLESEDGGATWNSLDSPAGDASYVAACILADDRTVLASDTGIFFSIPF